MQRRRRAPEPLTSPSGLMLSAFVVTVVVGLLTAHLADLPVRWAAGLDEGGPAAVALDTDGFDPAHIIDDEVFYDSAAMTTEEIADFISRVNDGCIRGADGTACLAEATFDTEDRDPTTACPGGYEGASSQSAAQVISKVADACDINPQVLLVLIQKEQGLLTASGSSLSARDYESAAGYACPDGTRCDAEYAGFFPQLYGAAAQFQTYRLRPEAFQVVAGRPVRVPYAPDGACGDSELTVATQATAGLYDYTPYQPNAAVASGGDECSSWGNWSFYGYFRTFFGDPAPSAHSADLS